MRNYLLLIGIDKYESHQSLNSCKKDLLDFKEILHEKYDFDQENTFELFNEEATNLNIQNSIKNFINILEPSDSLVIYYSGHGHYDESDKRGFWIPFDGNESYTSWFPNETLLAILNNLKCLHIFVISDSCFSSSILISNPAKSNTIYSNKSSRWALTSAYDQSYDSNSSSLNSNFAQAIIEFLSENTEHFRITKLIEHVKETFQSNDIQTPQGSPLKLSSHRSGEFVFKLKETYDYRNLKGFRRFPNILKMYKRNTQFIDVDSHENKTSKIGYRLFIEEDKVLKSVTYYLYLYEGCNQNATKKFLQEKHPKIFESKKLLVFIPKQQSKQKHEQIKSNIVNKFKPLNAFYIDEFLREQCTPIINERKSDSNNYLQITNFIHPTFDILTKNSNVYNFILEWISSKVQPILVIKGTGGVGKTTFAQYIIDQYQNINKDLSTLYIDSLKIKDELLKRYAEYSNITIYNFYEALYEQSEKTYDKLNEELFQLNLDIGNLLLVIDGLDEVISKIPNFNINVFLQSIVDISSDLGGAKVVITCRSHFWNKEAIPQKQIKEIELYPFDKKQTREFFDKTFSDQSSRKKAMKLAEEFKLPEQSTAEIYQPYVLDVIRSIIESDQNDNSSEVNVYESKYLNTEIHNEYIIYRVCERERLRVGQISVDKQIQFFKYFAVQKRGNINIENLADVIEEAIGHKIDDVKVAAFKSHLFLKTSSLRIGFRYDFLTDIFRSIFMSEYFDFEKNMTTLSKEFYDIVSENCWYGSGFLKDFVRRIKNWNENSVLIISDIIDRTVTQEFKDGTNKTKIVAHIFNLALLINHKFLSNTVDHNTKLMLDLFQKQIGYVGNLSIMNLNSDKLVKFDFSNLKIQNAYISNFGSFSKCSYNEETLFDECKILNIPIKNIKFKFPKEIFRNCTYDSSLENALEEFEQEEISKEKRLEKFLYDFFHLFYSNGMLGRQWEDKVIKPRFRGIDKLQIGYKKTMKAILSAEMIKIDKEKEGNKLSIPIKKKETVIRFVKDGTISNDIKNIMVNLLAKLK